MKTINISLFAWSLCTKDIVVDDDYEIKTDNPFEFIKDLEERYPEQFEESLLDEDFEDYPLSLGYCDVESSGLDYIDSINITDSADRIIESKNFKRIHYIPYVSYERMCQLSQDDKI